MNAACSKVCFKVFWPLMVGATFLCCSLIIYTSLVNKGNICSSPAECLQASRVRKDALSSKKCPSICTTRECIDISNKLLNYMDQSVSPCDDFYTFACGKYRESYLEDNRLHLFDMNKNLYQIFKDILEDSKGPPGSAAEKVKIVYESCTKKESSDLVTVQSLQQFLGEVGIPNWPHLNSSFAFENSTLEDVLSKLISYDEDIFLIFKEDEDYSFMNQKDGLFSLSGIPKDLEEEDTLQFHKKFVSHFLRFLGLNPQEINETLDDALAVEKDVLDLHSNNSKASENCKNERSICAHFFDCSRQEKDNVTELCITLQSVVRNAELSSRFSEDQFLLICKNYLYMKEIFPILNSYSPRAVAHYIALRFFINNLEYLNLPVRKNVLYDLDKSATKSNKMEKWKICISWLMRYMKPAVGNMYISHMWPTEAVQEVDELLDEYKNETMNFIRRQDGIEEALKEDLITELQKQNNLLPLFIKTYENAARISNKLKEFHPMKTNFVHNILSYKKFFFTSSMLNPSPFELPDTHKKTYPFDVSGFIFRGIYLSFGILLPPYFHHNYPKVFNMAKIGFIVGHEIGHQIYQYFEYFVENNTMGKDIHNQKRRCLIDQYFNFELSNIQKKLFGNLTVEENFCDAIGIKVTEKITEKYLDDMKETMFALPGLHYSPEELLYIAFVQGWCEAPNAEKLYRYLDKDEHSPPEFRMKGTLMNSRKFSEVFNCPPESYMNPEEKCSVFH